MNIEQLLHGEIVSELETLKGMEVGTDQYKTAVDGLTKLADRAIELEKIHVDEDLKTKAMDEEKKDRLIKNVLTALGIVIPTAVTIWGTCVSIKFEETGTFTTTMGRGFIQKLLPKK